MPEEFWESIAIFGLGPALLVTILAVFFGTRKPGSEGYCWNEWTLYSFWLWAGPVCVGILGVIIVWSIHDSRVIDVKGPDLVPARSAYGWTQHHAVAVISDTKDKYNGRLLVVKASDEKQYQVHADGILGISPRGFDFSCPQQWVVDVQRGWAECSLASETVENHAPGPGTKWLWGAFGIIIALAGLMAGLYKLLYRRFYRRWDKTAKQVEPDPELESLGTE